MRKKPKEDKFFEYLDSMINPDSSAGKFVVHRDRRAKTHTGTHSKTKKPNAKKLKVNS